MDKVRKDRCNYYNICLLPLLRLSSTLRKVSLPELSTPEEIQHLQSPQTDILPLVVGKKKHRKRSSRRKNELTGEGMLLNGWFFF